MSSMESSANANDDQYTSENTHRNPSPPPELLESDLLSAGDKIGDTIFSERWVLQVLMDLLEVVNATTSDRSFSEDGDVAIQELDKDLESKLCLLWDVSINNDVVIFMLGLPTLNIFADALSCRRYPRLTEIVIGICGNMSCVSEACDILTKHEKLKLAVTPLLDLPDPPTLTELFRFLLTCIQNESCQKTWLNLFEDDQHFLPHLTFIMASSTNVPLLKAAADFFDHVLDISDKFCVSWATTEFVESLLEAIQQIGFNDVKLIDTYQHVIQQISTAEKGNDIIVSHAATETRIISRHLVHALDDDFLDLEARAIGLASSLTILNILLAHSNRFNEFVIKENITRSILKLLTLVAKCHREAATTTEEEKNARIILEDSLGTLLETFLSSHEGSLCLLSALNSKDYDVNNILKYVANLPNGKELMELACKTISHDTQNLKQIFDALQCITNRKEN